MLAMSEKKFAMNKGRRRRKTGYPNHTSRDRRKDLHPVAMRGPVVPIIVHRPTPSPGFFRDSPIYHRKNAQKILPFFPGMEGVRWCTEEDDRTDFHGLREFNGVFYRNNNVGKI